MSANESLPAWYNAGMESFVAYAAAFLSALAIGCYVAYAEGRFRGRRESASEIRTLQDVEPRATGVTARIKKGKDGRYGVLVFCADPKTSRLDCDWMSVGGDRVRTRSDAIVHVQKWWPRATIVDDDTGDTYLAE